MSPFVVLLLLVLSLSYCPSSSAQVAGCPYGDPKVPAVGSGPAADRTSGFVPTASQLAALNNLTNFVILVLSEDSFDNLLATYPGANNLMAYTSSSSYVQQNTAAGTPYSTFPADPSNNIYSSSLPNQPFNLLSANASFTTSTIFTNPSHSFWQTQYKINGGKMDQFITWVGPHHTAPLPPTAPPTTRLIAEPLLIVLCSCRATRMPQLACRTTICPAHPIRASGE